MPLGFSSIVALALSQAEISGGRLSIEQAAYDVQSYDVSIRVNPATKSISGETKMDAKIVIPTGSILIDLDDRFTIQSVTDGRNALRYQRLKGGLRVFFPMSKQPGESAQTQIQYAGAPLVARNAPWDGGIVWAKTTSGAEWISVALQGAGADLIFPCKDHPSDRPNKATMTLTVPNGLTAVGPGKLERKTANPDQTTSFRWHMPLPINNYSLVFNAAPYDLVEDKVTSVTGEQIPIQFYVLPESKPNAGKLIEEQKKYLHFMEKICGPFPFRSVKMGIVETPHLGMEHSTAIAYGNKFRFASDGLDWLLLHEFGHEWWANLVSNADWRDMWIHEGFQSFMDTLYFEETRGKDAYLTRMKARRRQIQNTAPVAPREETSSEAYGGDIYDKGALILHSLRYLIGDEAFFRSIRKMAYPTVESEKTTDGSALRLVTTDDFVTIVNRESKQDLRWFFEVYVRHAALPVLKITKTGNQVQLAWETVNGLPFDMPVDVVIEGKAKRIEMKGGKATFTAPSDKFEIDPEGWVLKAASSSRSESRD